MCFLRQINPGIIRDSYTLTLKVNTSCVLIPTSMSKSATPKLHMIPSSALTPKVCSTRKAIPKSQGNQELTVESHETTMSGGSKIPLTGVRVSRSKAKQKCTDELTVNQEMITVQPSGNSVCKRSVQWTLVTGKGHQQQRTPANQMNYAMAHTAIDLQTSKYSNYYRLIYSS